MVHDAPAGGIKSAWRPDQPISPTVCHVCHALTWLTKEHQEKDVHSCKEPQAPGFIHVDILMTGGPDETHHPPHQTGSAAKAELMASEGVVMERSWHTQPSLVKQRQSASSSWGVATQRFTYPATVTAWS
jgi:hypothetical protein